MRRTWIAFGVALAVAVATAPGLGWWFGQRALPQPAAWAAAGQSVDYRGVTWTPTALTVATDGPEKLDTTIPQGAVVVSLQIDQLVRTPPENVAAMRCQFLLVNGDDEWTSAGSLAGDDAPSCDNDMVLLENGHQVLQPAWVVPASAIEGDPYVIVRFVNVPGAFGVRPVR